MKGKAMVKILCGGLLCLLMAGSAFYFYRVEQEQEREVYEAAVQVALDAEEILSFSVPSGSYDHDLLIEMSIQRDVFKDSQIYYTTDGSDPDLSSYCYTEPVLFRKFPQDLRLCSLKAVLYRGDTRISSVLETTYLLGDRIAEDLGDLYVVHLSSEYEGLYSYETGILVPGITHDYNVANGQTGYIHGNYNQRSEEWIRNAKVTMFAPDGELLLDQKIGLAVAGGTSASMAVKSLKLLASEVYDSNHDKFHLKLFEGSYSPLSRINDYTRLRVHAGQDCLYGCNIRSSVISRLAQESGFDGCTTTQRCLVFLNGSFYHILDLQQNYSDSFLKNRFSLGKEATVEDRKGSEQAVISAMGIEPYLRADLQREENRNALEQVVDMDSFLQYYAMNVLIQNNDWPQNNFEAWRYTGTPIAGNRYSDGRVRFLMYDVDISFYGEGNYPFFEGCGNTTLDDLMTQAYRSADSVFANVMQSEEYRNRFLTLLSDWMSTSFTEQNLIRLVDEEYRKIEKLSARYLASDLVKTNEAQYQILRREVQESPQKVRSAVQKHFGPEQTYALTVQAGEGVQIDWNAMHVYAGEAHSGVYYCGIPLDLTASAYPGYEFSHWEVNKTIYTGTEWMSEEVPSADGTLIAKAVARPTGKDCLVISEICAKSDTDWLRLVNAGETPLKLTRYSLSDDADNLTKYQLPEVVLDPQQTILINCRKNYYSLGDYICNFNLAQGETLYLVRDGVVVDFLPVLQMHADESYGRYQNSNSFVFYDNLGQRRRSS